MKSKLFRINYIYFGAYLGILSLLISSSVFTKTHLLNAQPFFFLYALGQVFLEIAIFIGLGFLIQKFIGKFGFSLFIGMSFVILFVHFFDFLMDRILDISAFEALRIFVLDESFENFFYLLDASGISLWMWAALFLFFLLLPLLGVFLYRFSDRLAKKKPLLLKNTNFVQAFVCIPAALLFWDYSASKVIQPDAYTAFLKSLPWKTTFLQPETAFHPLKNKLKTPDSENAIFDEIHQDNTVLNEMPNIYLFIVESLRKDVIREKIAPHLAGFKKSYPQVQMTLSNGNGTHLSWFSIFHSQFPFHWKNFQKNRIQGSPALKLLKKWGYKVNLYTSAQLSYYNMEELIFGKNSSLIDVKKAFHHVPPETAADTDAKAIYTLQNDLRENPNLQTGQIFIVFLDCTHFDYSWPKNWSPKFTPFSQEFAYFRAIQSKATIQAIKNRYNNSVNYMDSLFGSFYENLPKKEEAIVIFTGDHGEEFFEQGHLFHNSHLTKEQTHIPLLFKFGSSSYDFSKIRVASQMDIFPSIIGYLSGKTFHFSEGNSLFHKPKLAYAITARFNAGRTPYEFSIHDGSYKMIAQFMNKEKIEEAKELQIISLKKANDESLMHEDAQEFLEARFKPALDSLFQ